MQELMEERDRNSHTPSKHPCEGMSIEEILRYVTFLMDSLSKKDNQLKSITEKLDMIMNRLSDAQKINESNSENLKNLMSLVGSLTKERDMLARELEKQTSQNALNRKLRFCGKSQKGVFSKNGDKDRDDDKEDFDGTNVSNHPTDIVNTDTPLSLEPQEGNSNLNNTDNIRTYRLGMKYNKMDAYHKKLHLCDISKLPTGSIVVSREVRKVFDRVCYIEEHDFEYVTYRMPDGSMHTGYFPMKEDITPAPCLPGTHATTSLLSDLAFNKYSQMTPLYREINRYKNELMSVTRQTLTNWLQKAAYYLKKLLPALKDKALAPGSIVNVDETWCRLHLVRKSRKGYIWCLVNKLSKIVIFFYDNGSRSRGVLKEFIGDAEISALQSDGYIAYNYIDDQLINIDHICCLAHARAKFKYALEQGCDERAAYFLTRIADLYKLEDEYKKQSLPPDEIRERRNDESTTNILLEISCRLKLLLDDGQPKGDLMQKALNYLNHFWTQIISYRHDGRYSIDNSIAERCIRPLTRERANSIHYASHKGAETSAIFHTIFSTCKMVGVSALEYLRTFFKAILDGRTDYENLLPSTIGLKH